MKQNGKIISKIFKKFIDTNIAVFDILGVNIIDPNFLFFQISFSMYLFYREMLWLWQVYY